MTRGRSGRWWFSAALVFVLPALATAYEQQIRELAGQMAERLTAAGRKNVAVVDFTDLQGNVTELGRFLAEEMSVQLAIAGKGFEVVDRTHLKAILQEHKLAATGIIDPQTARKLGQIAGVDTIVTGSITPFGESVRLAVKVLNTTTAGMIAAATADIPKTKAVEELLGRGIGAEVAPQAEAPQTGASAFAPGRTGTPGGVQQTATGQGLRVDLEGCVRSGTSVSCVMFVTSERDDRTVFLTSARALDSSGVEYGMVESSFGSSRFSRSGANARASLITGVRTRASVSFEKVAGSVTSFSALEIGFGNRGDRIQFRAVPIK